MRIEYPLLDPWPVQHECLAAWVTARLTTDQTGTPYRRLSPKNFKGISALRSFHVDQGWPVEIFQSESIKRLIQGASRLMSRPQRQRLPITKDELCAITETIPNSALDYNLRACWLLAWAGFLRMGEVCWEEKDLRDGNQLFSAFKVTRQHVRFSPNLDHVQLTLPRSKTDKEHESVVVHIAATEAPTCAVKALLDLFQHDPQPASAPLFSFYGKAWSKPKLIAALKQSLTTAGYNPDTKHLHSFRKGAAQEALDNGVPPEGVQALGRWASEAYRLYCSSSPKRLWELSFQFQTGRPAPFTALSPLSPR